MMTLGQKRILIDCGPDFKQQALQYHLDTLDGIIFTHAHQDHVAGFDELRIYPLRGHHSLPCLLSRDTLEDLQRRFYYIFDPKSAYEKFTPKLSYQILESDRGETVFEGINLRYLTYEQGGMRVNGFCFGNLAYVTDIKEYPMTIFEDLQGIDTLIVSALRHSPSHLHFTVDEAIDFVRKVGAKQTWLTHITHDLDHEKTNAYLPKGIQMAYDGLQLDFTIDIT